MNSTRRRFIATGALATAGAAIRPDLAKASENEGGEQRILKSIKFQMLREKLSVEDKFKLLKDLGYDGVELNSPGGVDKNEALAASEKVDFPIHGAVDSIHWKIRLSDPDPEVRAKGLEGLKTAIHDVHFVKGSSVLLVPGKVGNGETESYEQAWERSIVEIRKVLPLAASLGIHILIENVWNGMFYDPKGDNKQTADELVKYIDEINSPWVGSYFDIGNHRKFCNPADWIRQLGRRIVKLDVKGWGGPDNKFTKIGEGSVDWADVRKALKEIGFTGWSTAEVGGGDRQRIAEIKKNMDDALGA